MNSFCNESPVIIGAVGGSGTRLIAQCLEDLGYFIGSDLNTPNDNLWVSLLFKRIGITSCSNQEFDELVEILIAGMHGRKLTDKQALLVDNLANETRQQHSEAWLKKRASSLKNSHNKLSSSRWGWKEPNSHIILDRLIDRMKNLKYIHVMRNGLDMAYSENQQQPKLWGPYFLGHEFNPSPQYSLRYWCKVHKRIFDIAQSMGDNFLLIKYEDFCLDPARGILKLCNFLGLDKIQNKEHLCSHIREPGSIGRYKNFSTDIFDENDLEYVHSLGYKINNK